MAAYLDNSGFNILPYEETWAAAGFDLKAWRAALSAANPWARRKLLPAAHNWSPAAGHATNAAFSAARKAACLERWREGAQAWNLWAAEMLRLRRMLEKAGLWRVETRFPLVDGASTPRQQGGSFDCAAWLSLSFADFSGAFFNTNADFNRLVFPGDLSFRTAEFKAGVGFQQANFAGPAEFSGATFGGEARFRSAHFAGPAAFTKTAFNAPAVFHSVSFTAPAEFQLAKFLGRATFKRVKFQDKAGFRGAAFRGWMMVRDAHFGGAANFESAAFSKPAEFSRNHFKDSALFRHARFLDWADFQDCRFSGSAIFENSKFSSWADFHNTRFDDWAVFQNARFSVQADFHDTVFANATDFQRADFTGSAEFQNAQFAEWTGFIRAQFGGVASFSGACFLRQAEFDSAWCASGACVELTETLFRETPNVRLAQLTEAPKLEHIGAQAPYAQNAPWSRLRARLTVNQDPSLPLKWRSLRQLSARIGDHDSARAFYLRELQSRRWLTDQPFPWYWPSADGSRQLNWPNGDRFWTGVFQELAESFETLLQKWLPISRRPARRHPYAPARPRRRLTPPISSDCRRHPPSASPAPR